MVLGGGGDFYERGTPVPKDPGAVRVLIHEYPRSVLLTVPTSKHSNSFLFALHTLQRPQRLQGYLAHKNPPPSPGPT